jgi:hypothetical protein
MAMACGFECSLVRQAPKGWSADKSARFGWIAVPLVQLFHGGGRLKTAECMPCFVEDGKPHPSDSTVMSMSLDGLLDAPAQMIGRLFSFHISDPFYKKSAYWIGYHTGKILNLVHAMRQTMKETDGKPSSRLAKPLEALLHTRGMDEMVRSVFSHSLHQVRNTICLLPEGCETSIMENVFVQGLGAAIEKTLVVMGGAKDESI